MSTEEDAGLQPDSAGDLTYSVSEAIDHIGAILTLKPATPCPCTAHSLRTPQTSLQVPRCSCAHAAAADLWPNHAASGTNGLVGQSLISLFPAVMCRRLWQVPGIPAGVCGPGVGRRRV